MFHCEICGAQVPPRTKAARIVLETRVRQYPKRYLPPKAGLNGRRRKSGEPVVIDRGGRGTEIVREANACPACAARRATAG